MKNSAKMLSKIKSRKVNQIPKWKFLTKNIIFWSLFLFSVILGSIAFSIILFSFQNTEFDLISHVHNSKIKFFVGLLPILWILFLAIFIFSSEKIFENTKKGYRYSPIFIMGGSFILSLVLGIFLFFFGGAEKSEHIFAEKVSFYKSLEEKKINLWSMPSSGFLSGIILEVNLEKIIIEDWENKNWEIQKNEALVRPKVKLLVNEKIKIIGEILEENIFKAEEIRPWNGKGKRRRK